MRDTATLAAEEDEFETLENVSLDSRPKSPPDVMTAPDTSPLLPYLMKLERRAPMPSDERAAFLALPTTVVRVKAHDVIDAEDAPAHRCLFVASGFLSRQKKANGSSKIVGFGIPGDAVDLQSLWFHTLDHSLVAHDRTTLISVEHPDMVSLCDRHPRVAKALWHDTLVDAAIFRQWTLNVGHRRARLRIAFLLLELAARLRAHKVIVADTFELPLSQADLASALGLSLVHFNKSLASLRQDGLIEMRGRVVTIVDSFALSKMVNFDDTYLHMMTEPKFESRQAVQARS